MCTKLTSYIEMSFITWEHKFRLWTQLAEACSGPVSKTRFVGGRWWKSVSDTGWSSSCPLVIFNWIYCIFVGFSFMFNGYRTVKRIFIPRIYYLLTNAPGSVQRNSTCYNLKTHTRSFLTVLAISAYRSYFIFSEH